MVAAGALASAMSFHVRISYAFGDAPWCAVLSIGAGEVWWDCEYRTVGECAPNVVAGNRGFCNLNPYGPGPDTSVAASRARHRKQIVQH
jgi:hypothetical protein